MQLIKNIQQQLIFLSRDFKEYDVIIVDHEAEYGPGFYLVREDRRTVGLYLVEFVEKDDMGIWVMQDLKTEILKLTPKKHIHVNPPTGKLLPLMKGHDYHDFAPLLEKIYKEHETYPID